MNQLACLVCEDPMVTSVTGNRETSSHNKVYSGKERTLSGCEKDCDSNDGEYTNNVASYTVECNNDVVKPQYPHSAPSLPQRHNVLYNDIIKDGDSE